MSRYFPPKLSAPVCHTSHRRLRLLPRDMMMFRYLLEGYDNLASYTVLDRKGCVIRLDYSPDMRAQLDSALEAISEMIPFTELKLPF